MADDPRALGTPHALERDTLVVRGADARTWLDGLVTCAVTQVQPGRAAYGLLLTKQGKIVTDVWLLLSPDGTLYAGVAPGHGAAVQQLLDRYLVMEDAELSAPPASFSWRIAPLGTSLPADGELAGGTATLGGASFSVQVVASSSPAGDLPSASELLAAHGFGVYGVDFSERDNPHEASLDRVAVSWTKGCYLGQEVVCMQDMRGKVKRRLTPLVGDERLLDLHRAAAAAGAVPVLTASGNEVGQVTSAHRTAGGALLLASMSSAALDERPELRVLGHQVQLADAAAPRAS